MWRKAASKWTDIKNNWKDYPLAAGKVWAGRFRIARYLGMGSYGQAYIAIDLESGLEVLLKRNKPSKGKVGVELLRRESSIMQQLNHPQIPAWLGDMRHGKEEALVMEYIPSPNFEYSINEQYQSYSLIEALYVVKGLLQPLGYMHAAGYVHRDVRIPNVLMHKDMPHLIDFGLACRIGERLPEWLRTALGEGTYGEGAGETVFADSGDAIKQRMRVPELSGDWFGLGHLFLFLMYAGYAPAEGQEERSWEEELGMPAAVNAFVHKLLGSGPYGSWNSTQECELELDRLLEQLANEGAI